MRADIGRPCRALERRASVLAACGCGAGPEPVVSGDGDALCFASARELAGLIRSREVIGPGGDGGPPGAASSG